MTVRRRTRRPSHVVPHRRRPRRERRRHLHRATTESGAGQSAPRRSSVATAVAPSENTFVLRHAALGPASLLAIRRPEFARLAPWGLAAVALPVWAASLPGVEVGRMTDLGLISVLTPGVFVALILLSAGFAIGLRQEPLRPVVQGVQVAVLIFMLYGITALVEEAPRFSVVYKHAGFAEFISRTGRLNTSIDAYFYWPGFFVMTAFVTKVAGLSSALDLAPWAPVFFNALWSLPVYMILASATANKRLVWLGVWLFFLADWVGQDYLSPQALNYFFYLLLLAILLTWFSPLSGLPAAPGWQRAGLLTMVLLVFAAIVSGHPLTPFFAIASVVALVVLRRFRPRMLPVVMVAMNAGWILVVALPLLMWQSNLVFGSAGKVDTIVSASVTSRVQGSPEHIAVIVTRIALTAALWLAAVAGAVRRFRAGHRDYTFGILALAPLTIIPLQLYGGEIALRAYMFSLPAVVFFATSNFFGEGTRDLGWRWTAAVGAAGVLLVCTFLITRYGNERIDYITYAEVAGVHRLYQIAPPGSILVSTGYVPWRDERVEAYDLRDLPAEALVNTDVTAVSKVMTGTPHQNAYFLFTRSEDAQVNMFYGLPQPGSSTGTRSGALERLVEAMIASGRYTVVFRNTDTIILAPVSNR